MDEGVDRGELRTHWESKIESLKQALVTLTQLEKTLIWTELNTIQQLKNDLTALTGFYLFLLQTQRPISNWELGYFSVLPTEVISCIFSYLDHKALCRVTQVCREFKSLADDERIWQLYWVKVSPSLKLPEDYPVTKPDCKAWKWLCQSKLHNFKEGQFKNGVGTYTYPLKGEAPTPVKFDNKYSGDWKAEMRSGFGTFYWCTGSWYIGEWLDDKRQGFGTRVWPNGNKYVGEYKNHKRHGNGEFTFSNGSIFKGKFEENKFVFGTYTWPNGRIYNGAWNNIYRHGTGTYWWPDGREYHGLWRNDKRHGHGVYKWPDGDEYEGEFVDGKRWGKGVLRRKEGEVFDQEWKEAKFEEFNKGIDDYNSETDVQISKPMFNKKRKKDIPSPQDSPSSSQDEDVVRRVKHHKR